MCLYSINAPCVVVQIQDFIFILCMYAPYRFFFVKYFLKSEFQNSWYHHYILKRRGDQKVPAIYMYMYGKLFCWSNFITEEKSLVSWDIYYVRVDGDPTSNFKFLSYDRCNNSITKSLIKCPPIKLCLHRQHVATLIMYIVYSGIWHTSICMF